MPNSHDRCVRCRELGHTADEHPLPKDHPQYDAFNDATDDELASMVSTAVWPNGRALYGTGVTSAPEGE